MKNKTISIALILALILSVFVFSGCQKKSVQIQSELKIDEDFSGTRTVNMIYPLDIKIDALKNKLLSEYPKDDNGKAVFSYEGVVEQGYKFSYVLTFNSKNEYIETLKQLLGRDVCVYLEYPDSPLLKGVRLWEDFSVDELIGWVKQIEDETDNMSATEYDYNSNLVNISGKIYSTDKAVNICEAEGYPINSVSVETTNLKNNRYDRIITFDIPNNTYETLSNDLKTFFDNNTDTTANYSGFISQGSSWQYKVIYEDLTIEKLNEFTNKLLCTTDSSVSYGDKTNSSTPLSEGMTFDENLNLLNFVGEDKAPVKLNYKYSLPTQTTHGDGLILSSGSWETAGNWDKSTYTADTSQYVLNIRIHDGMQYEIEGINFALENHGENKFVRTTEFLYSHSNGKDGCNYAFNYFSNKKAETTIYETSDYYVCKVTTKGSAREISSALSELFSSANSIKYTQSGNHFTVTKSTSFEDNINLGYMLTSKNIDKPMTYTVTFTGNETIKTVSSGEKLFAETDSKPENNTFKVSVKQGQGKITYKGSIPNKDGIVTFCVISSILVFITLLIVLILLAKNKKMKNVKPEKGAPTQTTTFNISELHAADKNSQKVRQQIDMEVQEKIDAQIEKERIEAIKAKIREEEYQKLQQQMKENFNEDSDNFDNGTKNTDKD